MGGLPRRTTFVEEHRQKKANFVVDSGGMYWGRSVLPESKREEIGLKADLVAQSYASAGIDAIAVSPGDLVLGLDKVKGLAEQHELPLFAANLVCDGEKPFSAGKMIERDGVKLGFIGAFVGSMPTSVDNCDATDPVQAVATAATAMTDVDALVVLGNWDSKTGKKLVEAVPAAAFVVSGSSATLADGQALARDNWMLSAGSKGKKIGLLTATLVPDGQGWQGSSPGAAIDKRLASYQKRLESNRKRLEQATDERTKKRVERQIGYYEKEIARLKEERAAATAPRAKPANSFENSLVALDSKIDDHEATRAQVDELKAELKKRNIGQEDQKPDRPLLPGARRGARGKGRAAPDGTMPAPFKKGAKGPKTGPKAGQGKGKAKGKGAKAPADDQQ